MTQEIAFSILVSGVVRIEGNKVTIMVNQAETTVMLPSDVTFMKKEGFEEGMTLNDILLESAREFVRINSGANRFSGADLYKLALRKYPWLKRNSFMSRVIADTPNHPLNRHFNSGRDYFRHLAGGLYQLNEQYLTNAQEIEQVNENTWKGEA